MSGGLDDYSILRSIGKGSYGEVHLIQHKREKKQYVIKKLVLQKASKRERKAAQQEAKLLSNLKHPNIISYKDSFESDDGFLYIVMGFAEGGDLYTKLREHRDINEFLTEVQIVRWFIQICMALQYLHQKHILHRDLKTQNIFLTKTKMIKVGDLGIARVLEGASDMATTLIGTPYYMSPELFSNKPYNYKSDVWALGCCVYEMTTLKHAFNAKDMNSLVYKILKKKMPKMPEMYSDELCDLIRSMLHQSAEKRPSVNKILRNAFIKQHIQLFLDESSKSRRPTSGRKSRARSEQKPSVSSSRCSSRESNNSVFEHETPQPAKVANPVRKQPSSVTPKDKQGKGDNKENRKDDDNKQKKDIETRRKTEEKKNDHPEPINGRIFDEVDAKRKDNKPVPQPRKPTPPSEPPYHHGNDDQTRVKSAESTSSSGSSDKVAGRRPLPKVVTPDDASHDRNESKALESSTSSVVSTASTKSLSSARERRRAKQRRERQLSRPSDSPKSGESLQPPTVMGPPAIPRPQDEQRLSSPAGRLSSDQNQRKNSSGEELNQFYTLLHTTLRLADDKVDESPPTTPTNQVEVDGDRKLSPVPELSESQLSTKENAQKSTPGFNQNTPQATAIDLRVPPHIQQNVRAVTPATLASTNKLMKRIVMLRKDCIKGLGVPLLHRAYELLDQENDEENLKDKLVELLGEVRYSLWAGKIWQLKFCEESIFQHCGSITAY
uniref:Serine/threonine-protein kinase Nek4 n=1 Tax=Phallusia mammillata TaxID=59560 RepID=A0A6F9DMD0_9ASCI|nr:serine/threonine-protein kinase Nek4 [Phallusia mammillata]